MKQKLFALFCAGTLLLLTGCTATGGTDLSSEGAEWNEYLVVDSAKEDTNEKAQTFDQTRGDESMKTESNILVNSVQPEKRTETEPEVPAKTKSVVANGMTYTAQFQETVETAEYGNGVDGRTVDLYSAENGNIAKDSEISFEYDRITGDLVFAVFELGKQTYDAETSITEAQAKKVARDFIKTQCDPSLYTFDSVYLNESAGYRVCFSRHVKGYKSEQAMHVSVAFDGKVKAYRHQKYAFDGIDLNVKIDRKKTEAELDKKIKKGFEDLASYKIKNCCVAVGNDKNLEMEYEVSLVRDTDEAYRSLVIFHVPIK